ncbi:ABC transporter ATP-binding protein [Alicyclobacillus dauci]|uniref:ABC transporter ATP-binding protein n=1 Tax=Alicyclobacillus dauci TaxID=1475485 RepID=A0ABY6Z7C8_9BACL|nr:ABC transporter ATP-binding protein [Alicyclobacillus dauci]WAH38694.1 ABC transporter ATP-binding protein [Alicyclobacillus dauci]
MANSVEIRNLTKRIGGKTIVDHLTFDIPQGEVFGLLGPNGAGKTTTIRMLVGLIAMTDGQVLIHGLDVTRNYEQAIRQVGAIVENPEMYKYLSGYENLVLYARMVKGIDKTRIDEVVQFVGLENSIHAKVKTYSLGMRQRLGLAQALLHKPSVLILDEPTNGLDPAGIRELRDHLRRLAKDEGVSVIVSSHLLSEMELMCDRVAIIQHGKLVSVERIDTMVSGDEVEQKVVFVVGNSEQGRSIMSNSPHVKQVQVVDSRIEIITAREHIPAINQQLVEAGVEVFEIRALTRSLEDTFLEMTGGANP